MLPGLPGLRVALASIALATAAANAPLQCGSDPDPRRRMEEDPSEVLFQLAERFKESGDREARAATLKYLVERYPSSRFAHMARQELDALGDAAQASPPPLPPPPSEEKQAP